MQVIYSYSCLMVVLLDFETDTLPCAHAEGVSTAAEHILQQGSEPQNLQPSDSASAQPADPPAAGGASWKGQQGVLGDLIHLWISWSSQPCQTVLRLLQGALAQVPSQPLTGKKAQEPVHPYPGFPPPSCHPHVMHDAAGIDFYMIKLRCGVNTACASNQKTNTRCHCLKLATTDHAL